MKEKMIQVFETHELMRIATMDMAGYPNVRSVDFVYDPEKPHHVYFTTFKNTQKVKEIEKNNAVYVVIDKSADSIEALSQIKYLRGKGCAFEIVSKDESMRAMGLLLNKYPFLKDLPGDASMMSLYRVELQEVKLTDNSLGFGHVETLIF